MCLNLLRNFNIPNVKWSTKSSSSDISRQQSYQWKTHFHKEQIPVIFDHFNHGFGSDTGVLLELIISNYSFIIVNKEEEGLVPEDKGPLYNSVVSDKKYKFVWT